MHNGKKQIFSLALCWIVATSTMSTTSEITKNEYKQNNYKHNLNNWYGCSILSKTSEKKYLNLIEDNIDALGIPQCNTSFKTYMDYRTITDKNSVQYTMQQDAWTDEFGLRRYGDDYMIALGTYYTDICGERFRITLDSGNSFTAVVGDIKSDEHTDKNNQYTAVYDNRGNFISANIVEFIVDEEYLSDKIKTWGSVGAISQFKGDIVMIERLYENDYSMGTEI